MATNYTSNRKIGGLDAVSTVGSTDSLVVEQSGDTKKATVNQLIDQVFGAKTSGTAPANNDVVVIRRGTDIRQLETQNLVPDSAITNAKIAAINSPSYLGISDDRLATIVTAGKVANSATTATNANTINTIVARDSSNNFSAGTITATLNGSATGNAGTATTLQNARTIAISGDVTGTATSFNGSANITIPAAITADSIVNADINSAAAIAHTKLANITAGQVLLGNASNAPTATALSGDVTINSSGVTAIGSGVIVDADVNASAAIGLSKLATGALPSAITVASANLVDGTIVNADINASAAIGLSKLATGALPSAITVSSANLVDGTIVNADINATAAIADTKLATISTAGKVSNSATTATNANTANAIVARDASGNFSAGTITASLSGNVTGNLTGTASAIADGSVSTAKIVDANVTNAKLASDIDASKLTTGTLPIARIADAAVTPTKLSQPLTLATAQATTSGTSIDFTGIPSWVKRITVMFNAVSTNGSSNYLIRIGAGSYESSGYSSTIWTPSSSTQSTAGFIAFSPVGAANNAVGIVQLSLLGSNVWVESGALAFGNTNSTGWTSAGQHSGLSGSLDRIRLTTVNGTDTFDAGTINIAYEG